MNKYRVRTVRALNGRIQGWAIEVHTGRDRWHELDYYPVATHGALAHRRAMAAAHKHQARTMADCPFCPGNWPNLDIVQDASILRAEGIRRVAIINPLNPVTDGHVLVICSEHSGNAAERSGIAADLMRIAAQHVGSSPGLQANIITSIGPHATQTVRHAHLHVVPRRPEDGLLLPWSNQAKHG